MGRAVSPTQGSGARPRLARRMRWGYNGEGELDIPKPNADFVAVSGGAAHALGLKSDGPWSPGD